MLSFDHHTLFNNVHIKPLTWKFHYHIFLYNHINFHCLYVTFSRLFKKMFTYTLVFCRQWIFTVISRTVLISFNGPYYGILFIVFTENIASFIFIVISRVCLYSCVLKFCLPARVMDLCSYYSCGLCWCQYQALPLKARWMVFVHAPN